MTDESLDIEDIVRAAQEITDPKELRKQLPVAYVLHSYGVEVVEEEGRIVAMCPFHDDSKPSLDVFGENLEFWGCYPCFGGLGGDVVDLIAQIDPKADRTARANELLRDYKTSTWAGPTKGKPRKTLDILKANEFVVRSFERANISLLSSFCQLKGLPFDGVELHQKFGVGTFSNWIIIPFYGPDGALRAFKKRELTTKPRAAAGSNFDDLFYNHWRLTADVERTVVLCEGESDTQATWHAVGDEYDVLGIPTGAGDEKGKGKSKPPQQAHLLAGRRVILAFDGDSAGRASLESWYDELTQFGCDVLFAPVPDGKDMCTVDDIATIIRLASVAQLQTPDGIKQSPYGYVRPATRDDKPDSPISNWFFEPTRELTGETGSAYEGTVEPGGNETVLSSFDLSAKSKLIHWSTTNGRAWYGSDRDTQLLLGALQSRGPVLASGKMATVAGLNEGHFVWPGHSIGPNYWKYVAPSADIHLAGQMWIEPGDWDPEQIVTLRSLHARQVMDPLMAWLAACPIRAMLREFPSLGVVGSSGTGKTTLMETVVAAFTSTDITLNLTDTTPHVITAYLGSINFAPVRFDERRPGARKSALTSIDQVVRDGYTGQKSAKGGGDRSNVLAVTIYAPLAPLIVSGEDSFQETSHTDRMIMIGLPPNGKNPEALRKVRAWGATGFAHAYITWIQENLDRLNIFNPASGHPDRQVTNMAVLDLGWRLLSEFMEEHDVELGAPDFSLPLREATEAKKHAPIEDALRWCLDEADANQFVFLGSDDSGEQLVCVRVENFVHFINKQGTFVLPGGITAVKRHLADKYGATEEIVKQFGVERRAVVLKKRSLHWDD